MTEGSSGSVSPRARLLLTGDELLRGFIQDANSGFIAAELRDIGIELDEIRIIGDDAASIRSAVDDARAAGVDLVVVTGGLGPTHDDRTSEAVAAATGRDLYVAADALAVVESRVRAFGRMRTAEEAETFAPGNRKQATIPVGATWIDPLGTAPGYVLADEGGRAVLVLPGPPGELRHAWTQALETPELQQVQERVGDRHERLVRLWGVPESRASQVLAQAGHVDGTERRVTICARDGELEIAIRGVNVDAVDALAQTLGQRLEAHVFATDDDRPVIELVATQLLARGWQLAVTESCTGGMLGSIATAAAGASRWFAGGLVTYSDEAKVTLAQVSQGSLDQHGAVSQQVAIQMAIGACRRLGTEVGIGITGVAGPGGGSDEKPVGTVHLGLCTPEGTVHRELRIPGNRETVRRRSCTIALHELRKLLEA